jgi:steroid 5-alpha reductase family enzyme
MTRSQSLALVAAAYAVAVGVAAAWLTWGPTTGRLWLDTLVADVLATLVVFAFSRAYRNSSFYDAYRSVIPPLLTFYWWSQSGPGVDPLRCWLVAAVVVLWAIRLAAVAVELVSDVQLHRFVRSRLAGEVMDRGLWSWSRHPNYFGEFSFWFALALFGVAASPSDAWWLFAGALAMLGMLLGASIPLMATRSLQRRPGYQEVIDRVPRFVPRPASRISAG